jgi:hypothetical protein
MTPVSPVARSFSADGNFIPAKENGVSAARSAVFAAFRAGTGALTPVSPVARVQPAGGGRAGHGEGERHEAPRLITGGAPPAFQHASPGKDRERRDREQLMMDLFHLPNIFTFLKSLQANRVILHREYKRVIPLFKQEREI